MTNRAPASLASRSVSSLSITTEHRIMKRKWTAVSLLVTGGVLLASKLIVNSPVPFMLFLMGHGIMATTSWKHRDYPLITVNLVWLIIDMIGVISWW